MKKMKTMRQNILVVFFASAFLLFSLLSGTSGSAQTKKAVKPAPKTTAKTAAKPTPKPAVKTASSAKPTPKPTPKVAAKTTKTTAKTTIPVKTAASSSSKPKSTTAAAKTAGKVSTVKPKTAPTPTKTETPKAKEAAQIIVASTSSRVRREPNTAAETIQTAKLGTIFPILEENAGWYKVALSKDDAEKNGWISKTVVQSFTNAKRGEIYQKIADKYLKQSSDFAAAAQLYEFLGAADDEVKNPKIAADLELKRLLALQAALKKIPIDKKDQKPYAEFLKANGKETVYSEPSAELLVVSREFWELHDKYKNLPIGEEIAWRAAQNSLPGECEGYINCYLYLIRSTDGEYLNFYPNGKYSRQALRNITGLLEPIAADSKEKSIYVDAGDISDRADFNRYLTEIRAIVSKTSYIEKSRTLAQIKQIGDAHR